MLVKNVSVFSAMTFVPFLLRVSFMQLYESCERLCQEIKILQLPLLPFIAIQQPTYKWGFFHAFYSYHLPSEHSNVDL